MPRALVRLNYLDTFYTDIWAGGHHLPEGSALPIVRRYLTRRHPEIPETKVVGFTCRTVLDGVVRSFRRKVRTSEDTYREYARVGHRFALNVQSQLRLRVRRGSVPSAYFGYTTGSLEVLSYMRDLGVPTIVGQIDPGIENELVRGEADRWPGWMPEPSNIPDEYSSRLTCEWAIASRVLVNSDWSRRSLARQGVPVEKIVVVPLAYESAAAPLRRHFDLRASQVTVLWVGQVSLRKGIQYLIAAANRLRHTAVRFVIVGPVFIASSVLRSAPSNMRFVGPVTRDRVSGYYAQADVFVLPTLSDGFAVTQLEAMAHGLPVIATPNCGEVVTEGVDGRIVPARDDERLAAAIDELAHDHDRRRAMSVAALATSKRFSIDALAERMKTVIDELA